MSGSQGEPNTPVLLTPTTSPAAMPGGAMLGNLLFGGIAIGKDTSGNLAFAPEGRHNVAARKQAPNPDNDTFWAAREIDGQLRLVDVTPIVRPTNDFIFRVPVRAREVEPGDVLILCDNPFQALFVKEREDNGTIVGLDLNSNLTAHVPSRQALLHEPQLLVQAISIFDLFRRDRGGRLGEDNINLEAFALLGLLGSGAAGTPGTGAGGSSGGQGAADLGTLLAWRAATGEDGDGELDEILPFLLLGSQSGDWSKLILLLNLLRRRHRPVVC